MEIKEFVKKKIGEIELWMMECKQAYPQDINECWRKRMPLLLGLSITAPLLVMAFRSDVWPLFWALTMAWLLILLATYMLWSKYKNQNHNIDNVRQSIESLMQIAQYPEVVEYGRRKQAEANEILAAKAQRRQTANKKCASIILASNAILIALILLLCKPYSQDCNMADAELNPNFGYLGISNGQEFETVPFHTGIYGGQGRIESQKCRVAAIDPWSNQTNPDAYAYLMIRGLEVSDIDDDGFYCLKLVDNSGLPIPYLPDFVFSKKSLAEDKEIRSSSQDSYADKFENLEMLRNLSQTNPKFIIRKIY